MKVKGLLGLAWWVMDHVRRGSNFGRVAMQQLQANYDGDFEKYINRMKKWFNVMEKTKAVL